MCGKDGAGNPDPVGDKVAELHQQLQRYIAGQDGAGGLREYSGSDGSFRPPRVGKVDQVRRF